MIRIWNQLGLVVAVFGLMFGATGPVRAGILLDLIDAAGQTDTPYALSFTASDSTTTISIAGYQIPAEETSTDNGLFLGGAGPNLLGSTWVFTPAASGSLAFTINDGSSVPGLALAGTTTGSYDTFSQMIATTPGQSYTLDLLYSNSSSNSPSGFLVTTSAIPEPSSLVLAGSGALAVLIVLTRSRKTSSVA